MVRIGLISDTHGLLRAGWRTRRIESVAPSDEELNFLVTGGSQGRYDARFAVRCVSSTVKIAHEDRMKNWLRENRGFILFLLCFGLFRTAIADWNPIPSGSMRPTLLEGDVVLVNRLAYDLKLPLTDIALAQLGEPQRGDIVTFSSPRDGMRLIKRIVAVPGDRIEMHDGVLRVNGEPAEYENAIHVLEHEQGMAIDALRATERSAGSERTVQYLEGMLARRSFAPLTVPAGSYFMMGDNRDNSADSRVFGFVPRRLLIGRAHRVIVSADIEGDWLPRFERIGRTLD